MEDLIAKYIKEKGYTFTVEYALSEREKYRKGFYVCSTAKDVIKNCIEKEEANQVSDYYKNRYKHLSKQNE